MFEPHEGRVRLQHTFQETYDWLVQNGPVALATSRETRFEAKAGVVQRGRHAGEAVIRFMQNATEYARAYKCCWRHYYNCNRTRIGMYCVALDAAISNRK